MENHVMKSIIICTLYKILWGWWNLWRWDCRDIQHAWCVGKMQSMEIFLFKRIL